MGLWIKICGNTSLEDALLTYEAGADAAGFVFAASPRRVTLDRVVEIASRLPLEFEKIGVFVDSGIDEISQAVERAGLTGVQLHGADAAAREGTAFSGRAAWLRDRFGEGLRILQVIHFGGAGAMAALQAAAEDLAVDGVLVDSRTALAVGGTGVAFDWVAARSTLFSAAGVGRDLRMIAAGGLNAANVAEAVGVMSPWGVDVVTGVEAAPGRKDAAKVRAFVAAARAAWK